MMMIMTMIATTPCVYFEIIYYLNANFFFLSLRKRQNRSQQYTILFLQNTFYIPVVIVRHDFLCHGRRLPLNTRTHDTISGVYF